MRATVIDNNCLARKFQKGKLKFVVESENEELQSRCRDSDVSGKYIVNRDQDWLHFEHHKVLLSIASNCTSLHWPLTTEQQRRVSLGPTILHTPLFKWKDPRKQFCNDFCTHKNTCASYFGLLIKHSTIKNQYSGSTLSTHQDPSSPSPLLPQLP